jgi:hypothetical protein
MVDAAEIRNTLLTYFTTDGELQVDDDGSVAADGHVVARRAMHTIPVRFSRIDGDLRMPSCNLQSLENCPAHVGGRLELSNNQLTNCLGMPTTVLGWVSITDNPLKTLDGFSKSVGRYVDITYTPTLPLLRLLVAPYVGFRIPRYLDNWQEITEARDSVQKIMNNYAGQGKRGAIRCQKELIAAGFEGNARW